MTTVRQPFSLRAALHAHAMRSSEKSYVGSLITPSLFLAWSLRKSSRDMWVSRDAGFGISRTCHVCSGVCRNTCTMFTAFCHHWYVRFVTVVDRVLSALGNGEVKLGGRIGRTIKGRRRMSHKGLLVVQMGGQLRCLYVWWSNICSRH